jgi:DNA-binding NarL/FixJ family response regulator
MSKIVAVVKSIPLKSHIQETLLKTKHSVTFANTIQDAIAQKSDIVILDLDHEDIPPVEALRKIREALPKIRIIAFYEHEATQEAIDLQAKAKHAGAEIVIPKSRFIARLSELVA